MRTSCGGSTATGTGAGGCAAGASWAPTVPGSARAVPQNPHSRNFDGFSSAQEGQTTVSGTDVSDVPQNPHSLNLAGFSSPQDGHVTVSMK